MWSGTTEELVNGELEALGGDRLGGRVRHLDGQCRTARSISARPPPATSFAVVRSSPAHTWTPDAPSASSLGDSIAQRSARSTVQVAGQPAKLLARESRRRSSGLLEYESRGAFECVVRSGQSRRGEAASNRSTATVGTTGVQTADTRGSFAPLPTPGSGAGFDISTDRRRAARPTSARPTAVLVYETVASSSVAVAVVSSLDRAARGHSMQGTEQYDHLLFRERLSVEARVANARRQPRPGTRPVLTRARAVALGTRCSPGGQHLIDPHRSRKGRDDGAVQPARAPVADRREPSCEQSDCVASGCWLCRCCFYRFRHSRPLLPGRARVSRGTSSARRRPCSRWTRFCMFRCRA